MFRKDFWIAVGALLIAFAIYLPFSPMWQQRRGMRQASDLGEKIQLRIDADPELASASASVMTNPVLLIIDHESTPARADKIVQISREEYDRVPHTPAVRFHFRGKDLSADYPALPAK